MHSLDFPADPAGAAPASSTRQPGASAGASAPGAAPLPHRKVIRGWLAPYEAKRTLAPLLLVAFDFAVFLALLAGAVWPGLPWWLQLAFSVLAGLWIGRLFILGHDACHQALTPSRTLNRIVGRLTFLASLTPYSLWEIGHNVVHHGYTNLKGVDFVWAPASVEEYRAMPAWRRMLERVYRSGWGVGLYYLIEIWWLKMYFPSRRQMPAQRGIFVADNLLVSLHALLWIGAALTVAADTDQSALWLVTTGVIVPFLVWNTLIGFVVYVHHTHPEVEWYADKGAWAASAPFVSTTVHLQFPARFGAFLHHIMEHTAHHVSMSVPLYRLRAAQALLEEKLPGRITIQRFSMRWFFATARRCKLYDFESRRWLDFAGRPVAS